MDLLLAPRLLPRGGRPGAEGDEAVSAARAALPASHLKARGFDVRVFDSTFRSFAEFEALLDAGAAARRRAVLQPDDEAQRAADDRGLPTRRGASVVVGGPDPPHHAQEYLEHGADIVVIGEGERTLEELLPRLLARPRRARPFRRRRASSSATRPGSSSARAPRALIPSLDEQPLPDRDADRRRALPRAPGARSHGRGLRLAGDRARLSLHLPLVQPLRVRRDAHRRRTPGNVADEVQAIRRALPPGHALVRRRRLHDPPRLVLAYARRAASGAPCACPSSASRAPSGSTRTWPTRSARMGCLRLWIGSESGSQRVLDAMERRVKVEQVQQATRLLQRHGDRRSGMFVMLGYEGEQQSGPRGDRRASEAHAPRTCS